MSEGRLEDPEIFPEDSVSQVDANDDSIYDSFDDMTHRSVVYAQTDLTAGGDDPKTFRKRLDKAGLDSYPDIDTRHDAVVALIRSPKALPKVQEKTLIGRLVELSTKLKRDSVASEAYLESNMNQIIEVCSFTSSPPPRHLKSDTVTSMLCGHRQRLVRSTMSRSIITLSLGTGSPSVSAGSWVYLALYPTGVLVIQLWGKPNAAFLLKPPPPIIPPIHLADRSSSTSCEHRTLTRSR